MKYRAIKAYDDAPENPITIVKGEVLELLEESDPQGDWPNWVLCKGEGKQGWVPRQVLELDGKQVTAQKDYCAREHTLTPDEVLFAEFSLNGWIWGYKESEPQQMAWAPLNHLSPERD